MENKDEAKIIKTLEECALHVAEKADDPIENFDVLVESIVQSMKKLTMVEKMVFLAPVKTSKAYEEYAKNLGKSVKRLTDGEKRTAVLLATLKGPKEKGA